MSHLWHKIKLLDGHFTYLCKFIIKYILVLLCFRYDVWKKSRDNDNQGKEQRCQRSLEQCGFRSTSVTVTYGTNHPQQIQITNAIVNNLIIQGNISLYMVNTDWFRSFIKTVDPKYDCPSSYKVRKMITTMYKNKRDSLQTELANAKWTSITLDMWSDRRMRSFLGITVHFLNENLQRKSMLLEFTEFDSNHTADNIVDKCMFVLDSYGIRQKVCYIITDNAANMIAAFRDCADVFGIEPDDLSSAVVDEPDDDHENLDENRNILCTGPTEVQNVSVTDIQPSVSSTGSNISHGNHNDHCDSATDVTDSVNDESTEDIVPYSGYETTVELISKTICRLVRLPCGIHTLQLVVLDGLKTAECLSDVLSKCSRLSTILHTSGKFSQQYFLHFKVAIPKTTKTRWNSTFLQLQAVAKLDQSKLEGLLRKNKHKECVFSYRETKILKEAVDILESAYDATIIMEEENASISLIAPTVYALQQKWRNMLGVVSYTKTLLNGLLQSLENRFGGIFLNIGSGTELINRPTVPGGSPFEYQVYIIAAALDAEFRLNWLDELTKARYTGHSYILRCAG
jgi:hypothetical protein